MSPLTHFEEDGVHVFQFHDRSRQAVDAYLTVFKELFTQINAMQYPEPIVRAVIDVHEKGLFPLRYAINYSRQIIGTFKYIPQVYYAYIVDDMSDISLIRSLDYYSPSPQKRDTRRVFPSLQIEEAKEWLRTKLD